MQKDKTKPILFVLSIDTEEEWDWSESFPQQHTDVKNVDRLPAFQEICTELSVRPTYFVDYAVADCEHAVNKMLSFVKQGECEIGAHIHPWCNPPYFGDIGEAESHVVNLPLEQVSQKLDALVARLEESFHVKPTSFRTGRWGIDNKVLKLLVDAGFTVDSSVYPYYQNQYFSCHGCPTLPYWPDLDNPLKTSAQDKIYELPVTVGFNRHNFEFCNDLHSRFSQAPLSWTRFNGLAWHLNILRKIYLSPEFSTSQDMLTLCKIAINKGYPVLHMYMHSSSLMDNENSLIGNQGAFNFITDAVKHVISELKADYDIEFCTITEAAKKLQALGK